MPLSLSKLAFLPPILALKPRFWWQKGAYKKDTEISNKENGHRPPEKSGLAGQRRPRYPA